MASLDLAAMLSCQCLPAFGLLGFGLLASPQALEQQLREALPMCQVLA